MSVPAQVCGKRRPIRRFATIRASCERTSITIRNASRIFFSLSGTSMIERFQLPYKKGIKKLRRIKAVLFGKLLILIGGQRRDRAKRISLGGLFSREDRRTWPIRLMWKHKPVEHDQKSWRTGTGQKLVEACRDDMSRMHLSKEL